MRRLVTSTGGKRHRHSAANAMSGPTPEAGAHNVTCAECGAPMVLRRRAATGSFFWGCSLYPRCTGAHGAHQDGRPLGTPADTETKAWRIKAHEVFDALWQGHGNSARSRAYRWLRKAMRLDQAGCHIGRFTAEQCQEVIALALTQKPFSTPLAEEQEAARQRALRLDKGWLAGRKTRPKREDRT